MSTESQINANRLNAQKSTGPKTPEGKKKVSQNAVTHGLTAFRPVLANEDPAEYILFRDDFFRNYAPAGILEESLAQRAADTFWRLQRAQDYETAVLNTLIHEAQNPDNPDASQIEHRKSSIENDNNLLGQILLDDFRQTHCLEKIQKYEMAIERSFYRTIKELRMLQSLRQNVGEASVLHSKSANSKKEQNKPNIPNNTPKSNIENRKLSMIDPIKLLEKCLTNPIGLDPLTKIMMKKDNFQRLAKKAM